MISFAKYNLRWFNIVMKSYNHKIKEKIISRYTNTNIPKSFPKSTDINVLLNRVKTNQKNEIRKKLFFSAAASTGLFLFGLLIF